MALFGNRTARAIKEVDQLLAERSYATLSHMLFDRDTEIRNAASCALQSAGLPAIPAIVYPGLNTSDKERQKVIGRALRPLGAAAADEVFFAYLRGDLDKLSLTALNEIGAAAEPTLCRIALGIGDWEGFARLRWLATDIPVTGDVVRSHARLGALAAIKVMVLSGATLCTGTVRTLSVISVTSDAASRHAINTPEGMLFATPYTAAGHEAMYAERVGRAQDLLDQESPVDAAIVPLPPLFADDIAVGVLAKNILELSASPTHVASNGAEQTPAPPPPPPPRS